MKLLLKSSLMVASVLALTGPFALADKKEDFKTEAEKAAYIIGHQTGANFMRNGVDLDIQAFNKGLAAGLKGADSVFDGSETQKLMQEFQKTVSEKREKIRAEQSVANKKAGTDFLEANKKKDGIKTTASGLQYKVIKEGKGVKPTANDTVTTHYKGTLINGKVFDSSYDRGEPATFPVAGVIKGWTEALQMMPVGSKWELYIPSELAYGSRGAGADIGPDETLVFEVELLDVKKKDEPKKEEK